MAYKIKKSNRITEDLDLLDENNNVALTLNVDIDIDKIAKDYRTAMNEVVKTEKAVKDGGENALEIYGDAIINAFKCIFGDENTANIIEYFDGKYTDMFIQCMPFINDVIHPAIEEAVNSKREMLANNYNLSRQQKRSLGIR